MIKRTVTDFFCTEDAPIVQTKAGKLHGYRANGIYQFKGVAYAHAKRFQAPEPVAPWAGVKDALAYGPGCPEMTYSIRGKGEFDFLEIPGRIWPVSEDCQNLNVWTKSLDPRAKRPVMVWLHGGGFSGGSNTHLYAYEGFEMANLYDVVIVTVNHRLNMFGYMNLAKYGGPYKDSGVAGMLDIVEALRWVRGNIASFGGDPDNVTIYGQSGGGMKVTALMQMPSADGLYHRAIVQSGVRFHPLREDRSAEMTDRVLAKLGLSGETVEKLGGLDSERIADAVKAVAGEMGFDRIPWEPVPTSGVYAGYPFEVGFRKETKDIPMIVGSVIAELYTAVPTGDKTKWTEEMRDQVLRARYGDGFQPIRQAFGRAYPERDPVYAAMADYRVRDAVLRFLNLRNEMADAPAYNYLFAFESPLKGGKLLGHNSDLHFVFHNAHRLEAFWKPGVTERQQDAMAGAWARFAHTGNPNGAGLPAWKPYTREGGECMRYCENTRMTEGHDRELMAALKVAFDANPAL